MAKVLMKKKKSRGSFSTSTPKASNQISSTSSNQAMEMTSEADSVNCETADLETRAGELTEDKTEATKEKQGWTEEDFAQFAKLLNESNQGVMKKSDITNILREKTNEDCNETKEEDNDYLEAAKKWTVQKKLSFKNKK